MFGKRKIEKRYDVYVGYISTLDHNNGRMKDIEKQLMRRMNVMGLNYEYRVKLNIDDLDAMDDAWSNGGWIYISSNRELTEDEVAQLRSVFI